MSTAKSSGTAHAERAKQEESAAGSAGYLLAGQASELERLQLQSRVWEPSGRRLLEEIGDGRGARALDVGCGVLGWLRVLSEWVGPDGEVTGTDIDEAMLAAADRFVTEEGLRNVGLVKDDLFASELEPDSFDLVHARYEICPLGRGARADGDVHAPRAARRHDRARGPRHGLLALQSAGARSRAADRADRGGVSAERGRLGRGAKAPPPASRVRHRRKRQGRGRGASAGTSVPAPASAVRHRAGGAAAVAGERRRARGASRAGRGRASGAWPLGHHVHAPAVLGPVPGGGRWPGGGWL